MSTWRSIRIWGKIINGGSILLIEKIKRYPILFSILFTEILAIIIGRGFIVFFNGGFYNIIEQLWAYLLGGIFIIYPLVLTLINIIFVFIKPKDKRIEKKVKWFEYITIILGTVFSSFSIEFFDIKFNADWMVTLHNNQVHTPLFTESQVTIIVIMLVAIVGYFCLSLIPLEKMPPLVTVCCIAAMYLGSLQCIIWIIQILSIRYLIFCLFPFNCVIIALKTIRLKVLQWKEIQHDEIKLYKYDMLNSLNRRLMDSNNWTIMAFIIMWPLLGILICILSLFGQRPDAIIRSWTETSDWNLSRKIAPQNIYVDEHYLCTVAAGGHRRIVKPIRRGVRHGHEVIVNRQLCVANAFEQILEEKTPRLHGHVRSFYDKYGFPIAKIIHSPYTADIIYFLMKPLEWIFLIVLYFCDVKPENRIATQYITKRK